MELKLKEIYEPETLPTDKIGYIAIITKYNNQWVIVRLEGTDFWEFPGGTIEEGELPLEAARRELHEETGAIESSFLLLGQYSATIGDTISYGNIYYAEISKLGPLPDFEIAEITYVDDFPLHSTRYPKIIPDLFLYAKEKIEVLECADS